MRPALNDAFAGKTGQGFPDRRDGDAKRARFCLNDDSRTWRKTAISDAFSERGIDPIEWIVISHHVIPPRLGLNESFNGQKKRPAMEFIRQLWALILAIWAHGAPKNGAFLEIFKIYVLIA